MRSEEVTTIHEPRVTVRPFDRPFGHELPSGLSLRVEDKAEWLTASESRTTAHSVFWLLDVHEKEHTRGNTNCTIGKHLQIKYTEFQHIKRVNAMLDLYVPMLITPLELIEGE